jgi:hypothetical protein
MRSRIHMLCICFKDSFIFGGVFVYVLGTRWCGLFRHCATSRRVAGSIPDSVNRIFYWHNLSGCTMAMGSTQPLAKMSTRNFPEVKSGGYLRLNNITTPMCRLFWNLGSSTSWKPTGLNMPELGLHYHYVYIYVKINMSFFIYILSFKQYRPTSFLLIATKKKWISPWYRRWGSVQAVRPIGGVEV